MDRLHSLISGRQDFIYETTLSSHQSIKLLKQAREAGYSTLLCLWPSLPQSCTFCALHSGLAWEAIIFRRKQSAADI